APALGVDEGALTPVSLPHDACHFAWHVARARLQFPPLLLWLSSSDASPHLPFDERVEGSLDHRRELAPRHRMAQELPGPLELREELGARREFNPVARGRERFELGASAHAAERIACLGTGIHRPAAGRRTGGSRVWGR